MMGNEDTSDEDGAVETEAPPIAIVTAKKKRGGKLGSKKKNATAPGTGISGVRSLRMDILGTMRYEGISGIRWDCRGTMYEGYKGL